MSNQKSRAHARLFLIVDLITALPATPLTPEPRLQTTSLWPRPSHLALRAIIDLWSRFLPDSTTDYCALGPCKNSVVGSLDSYWHHRQSTEQPINRTASHLHIERLRSIHPCIPSVNFFVASKQLSNKIEDSRVLCVWSGSSATRSVFSLRISLVESDTKLRRVNAVFWSLVSFGPFESTASKCSAEHR